MSGKGAALLALLCALSTVTVWADSWSPPEVRTYASSDGAWRLTVHPRQITSQLDYFQDKVADRPNAGGISGSTQTSALGHMEHRDDSGWRTAWKAPLINEVSPVEVLVLSGGRAVTFDNWHSMGYGKDVIAIYDGNGKLVRALALADFLPKEYIHALPRSVSSIHWRGSPRVSGDSRYLLVPVVIPSAQGLLDAQSTAHVDVRFDLASGQLIPNASPAWLDALASARKVHQKLLGEEAAQELRFISPLRAPVSDVREWHGYLVEAFFRLDPDWDDGYPATKVIPNPDSEGYERLVGYLRDALSDESNGDGVLMIAAPSQDVLVNVLKEEFARVGTGALADVRVYVVVDQRHVEAVRGALAHTGADFIQLDPRHDIPQRKERLDRYLDNKAENSD